jgi:glucose/arabinose dehydrogenase
MARPVGRLAIVAALAGLLFGCDAQSTLPPPTGIPSGAASPSGAATDASPAPTARSPSVEPTAVLPDVAGAVVVASGLEVPWGLDVLPDGRAIVTERETGRLLVLAPGEAAAELARIEGLPATGEGGLLGVAVDPHDADVVYAFVNTGASSRIVRLRSGGAPDVVLDAIPATSFHTGGGLAFGPDGMLYASVGDAQDPELPQDPSSLAGKILRLTPDGAIPADNPDPGSPVFAAGFRNVEGFAWDDRGRLWAVEFGEAAADELDLVELGANYGWPLVEGTGGEPTFRDPVLTWPPADASPPGVAFGHGALWITALRGERLWRVPLGPDGQAGPPESLLAGVYGRLRSVDVAPDGALWLTTSNRDGRGDPRPGDDLVIRIPLSTAP